MPQNATGNVRWVAGVAVTRAWVGKKRPSFPMPHVETQAEANERAKLVASFAQRLAAVGVDHARTVHALKCLAAAYRGDLDEHLEALNALCVGRSAIGHLVDPAPEVKKKAPNFEAVYRGGRWAVRLPDPKKLVPTTVLYTLHSDSGRVLNRREGDAGLAQVKASALALDPYFTRTREDELEAHLRRLMTESEYDSLRECAAGKRLGRYICDVLGAHVKAKKLCGSDLSDDDIAALSDVVRGAMSG